MKFLECANLSYMSSLMDGVDVGDCIFYANMEAYSCMFRPSTFLCPMGTRKRFLLPHTIFISLRQFASWSSCIEKNAVDALQIGHGWMRRFLNYLPLATLWRLMDSVVYFGKAWAWKFLVLPLAVTNTWTRPWKLSCLKHTRPVTLCRSQTCLASWQLCARTSCFASSGSRQWLVTLSSSWLSMGISVTTPSLVRVFLPSRIGGAGIRKSAELKWCSGIPLLPSD